MAGAGGSQTIRELLIRVGVDADEALKDFGSVEDAFDDVKAAATELIGVLAGIGAGLAAVAGLAVGQAAATAQSAQQIERQAAALGLTTDAYQELAYATGKYGVQAEDLADAFGQISQLSQDAAGGSAQLVEKFALLGITVDDLRASSPEALFGRIADGLANTTDATTRLSLAGSILGEDLAKKLGPLLLKGAAGVAELRAEAQRLGIVMDEAAIAKGVAFSEQLSEIGTVATALRQEFALSLIPALTKIGTRFLAWYEANREVINQRIDEYALAVARAFTDVADGVAEVDRIVGGAEGWDRLGKWILFLGGATGVGYVASKVLALAESMRVLFGATAALGGVSSGVLGIVLAGILAIAAATIGVSLALDDLSEYFAGNLSLFGTFAAKYREGNTVIGAVIRNVEALGNLIDALGQPLLDAIDQWGSFTDALGNPTPPVGLTIIRDILDGIIFAIDLATANFNRLAALRGGPIQATGADGVRAPVADPSASFAYPALPAFASSFAPTASPEAGRAPAGGSVTQTVGGDTNNYYGLGVTKEEVESMIATRDAQKIRQAKAIFADREA